MKIIPIGPYIVIAQKAYHQTLDMKVKEARSVTMRIYRKYDGGKPILKIMIMKKQQQQVMQMNSKFFVMTQQ